jgi:hypothetical protein
MTAAEYDAKKSKVRALPSLLPFIGQAGHLERWHFCISPTWVEVDQFFSL